MIPVLWSLLDIPAAHSGSQALSDPVGTEGQQSWVGLPAGSSSLHFFPSGPPEELWSTWFVSPLP